MRPPLNTGEDALHRHVDDRRARGFNEAPAEYGGRSGESGYNAAVRA